MKPFKQFLVEKNIEMNDLDMDFIRRAEVVTSFNVTAKDFQSVKNKNEVRFLFKKHFFPDFDLDKTVADLSGDVNGLIKQLKSMSKTNFDKLFTYNIKGVGPGEVLLYFLVDDLVLGGGTSAGVDLVSGGKSYEMKAAQLSKEGYFYSFRLGATVNVSSIVTSAIAIAKEAGISTSRDAEISKSAIASIKSGKLGKRWVDEVEKPFIEKAYDEYFKHHPVAFIINKIPASAHGEVYIKSVKKSDIVLEMVTQGKIRPMIKK